MRGVMDHPSLGVVRYSATPTSEDPDQQVADTISLMRQYAGEDARSPVIASDVAQAQVSNDPIADTWNYINRYSGTRGMRFTRDEAIASQVPIGQWRPCVETLIRPVDQAMLPNPQGDCDDFAMYGAAHLQARGVPCSFATVAADGRDPNAYSHVYLVAYPSWGPYAGMRVPMDLSHGSYLGWEVPNAYGKFCEWSCSGIGVVGWGLLLSGGYLLYRSLRRAA
jgi:hypothetical protein